VEGPKSVYDTKYDYLHFLIVSQFNHNFTDKYFINIINKVIYRFCFKPRLNNTSMNPHFESGEFGPTNLAINVNISTFKQV